MAKFRVEYYHNAGVNEENKSKGISNQPLNDSEKIGLETEARDNQPFDTQPFSRKIPHGPHMWCNLWPMAKDFDTREEAEKFIEENQLDTGSPHHDALYAPLLRDPAYYGLKE